MDLEYMHDMAYQAVEIASGHSYLNSLADDQRNEAMDYLALAREALDVLANAIARGEVVLPQRSNGTPASKALLDALQGLGATPCTASPSSRISSGSTL